MELQFGLAEHWRDSVVALYQQALHGTVWTGVSKEQQAALLFDSLDLAYVIAVTQQSTLLGIAGFQIEQGSFTGAASLALLHWRS